MKFKEPEVKLVRALSEYFAERSGADIDGAEYLGKEPNYMDAIVHIVEVAKGVAEGRLLSEVLSDE